MHDGGNEVKAQDEEAFRARIRNGTYEHSMRPDAVPQMPNALYNVARDAAYSARLQGAASWLVEGLERLRDDALVLANRVSPCKMIPEPDGELGRRLAEARALATGALLLLLAPALAFAADSPPAGGLGQWALSTAFQWVLGAGGFGWLALQSLNALKGWAAFRDARAMQALSLVTDAALGAVRAVEARWRKDFAPGKLDKAGMDRLRALAVEELKLQAGPLVETARGLLRIGHGALDGWLAGLVEQAHARDKALQVGFAAPTPTIMSKPQEIARGLAGGILPHK